MTDKEQREIFRKNLLNEINRSGKRQIEIAEAIGVSQQTFNTWCRGIALPRIGKIELLASFFGIPKSALLDAPAAVASAPSSLSQDQESLLQKYEELNDLGKEEALKRVSELAEIQKYTDFEKEEQKLSG
ncbi:MAG: helix-turn-helix domain-containing protein [Lachnospiraceae bacterium]|nr:helix-turn-helix domain-containing protein [Lachnospiraceae bacterium]